MCHQSCLGGSRLPLGYRVWNQRLTAWRVGGMRLPRHRRMIQHQLMMVYQKAQDVVSLVVQWDERMRSTPSGCGLLSLPRYGTEWVSVREDRLHEVPADRDQALTCHPRLTRWEGCHPVTVYGPYNAQSVILTYLNGMAHRLWFYSFICFILDKCSL